MAAVISHNAYTASAAANIHTATQDEIVNIRITNRSGGTGSITGLSVSSTTGTHESGGYLLGDAVSIDNDETITIKGVVLNATEKYVVLSASVNLDARVDGVNF